MGSKILSQTFLPIPKTLLPQSTDKFGFSTVLSSRPSSFNSTPITISRVSSTKFHVLPQTKRSLVVRAESNSEGEVEATADGETEVVALAVADAEAKPPRTPRIKLGDIMGILNKRAIEAADEIRPTPDLRPGDIVEIKLEVPENRRRSSTYKGIVIGKQNAGIHTTIRIRRIIAGVGVEIVFPVYSPNVKMIKVVKHRKVRRAKLYYLRDKLPRLSTFK